MDWTENELELRRLMPDASDDELSFILGISASEMGALSSPEIEPPLAARRRLAATVSAIRELRSSGVSQRESFMWWITGPRPDAAGLTPLEWIRRGGHPELAIELAISDRLAQHVSE